MHILGFHHTPHSRSSLINTYLTWVLSGKPSASGAELEGAILLKNDPVGDLRRRITLYAKLLIPY